MSGALDPLLITVAPTGADRGVADHELVICNAQEIGTMAARCRLAGAGLLHLQVRDAEGGHSLSPALYRELRREILRMAGDEMLVQISTASGERFSISEQINAVRGSTPESAAFAIREFFPDGAITQSVVEFFAFMITARRLCTQFVLYAPSEVALLVSLIEQGLLPLNRAHGVFCLQRSNPDEQADSAELDEFLRVWPAAWPWTLCAYGRAELGLIERVIGLGGHVRLGYATAVEQVDGAKIDSNSERVWKVANLAQAAKRPLATPQQARALLRSLPAV